jgi:hypothetical protein
MTRPQLEHILRACAGITGATEFVIIGSQAILGAYPNAPDSLRESMEADVFTLRSPDDAELIDGSIGELSPFHQTFGYHAHGVGPETATLPQGWQDRLIQVSSPATHGATGLCLEPHDLAIAKLVAGREKDHAFVAELLRYNLINLSVLNERASITSLPDEHKQLLIKRLERLSQ